MNIKILSNDQLWLDSISLSLKLLTDGDVQTFCHVSLAFERMVESAERSSVLLIDSGIPGVDYWALTEWLGIRFRGRAIILKDSNSYNLCAEKMVRHGCHAVLDKSAGMPALWLAMSTTSSDRSYQSEEEPSLFSGLTDSEKTLARDLLSNSVTEISKYRGISQQAINKQKLLIYKKLNIVSSKPDDPFKCLAKFFRG